VKRVVKWGLAVLVLAVACGSVSFWATRTHLVEERHEALLDDLPELEWVRKEFALNDEEFARVRALHLRYRPKCVEMCDRIREVHDRISATARTHGEMSPELEDAIEEHARVHAECQQAMLEHLYETAAVLEEAQGRRYLDAMLPYALDFKYSEPNGGHGH
jgi:hypothetical protein